MQAACAAHIPVIVIPDLIPPTEETLKICLARMDSLLDVRDYIVSHDIHG